MGSQPHYVFSKLILLTNAKPGSVTVPGVIRMSGIKVNIYDAENLERLEKKIGLIRDRVRAVALRYNTGLFLFGEGGSGKSYAVRGELDSLGTSWLLHNSAMSAAGLFEALQDLPDIVHVFEDMEHLYSDKKVVGYLRSATWGDENNHNRIVTRTIHKSRESFEFTGGIIILSNLPLGEIASLKALASRLNPAEFNPTEGEKQALMWKIAEQGKFDLPSAACIQQFPVEPTAEVCVPDFRFGRLG